MKKRPLSITIIGWLFIAAGAVGLTYHATEFRAQTPFQYDVAWVCLVRFLAILSGGFMLRGRDWARWLLIVWMGYHIVLSAFHSLSSLGMHSLLFGVITWFLLRPQAAVFFARARGEADEAESARRA
jgi:hypothetical protein